MSVNPDDMDMSGPPMEYSDLEHQVIRQKIDFLPGDGPASAELLPGQDGAEFDPGERQLDREEVAQLVYYRRYATLNTLTLADADDNFAIVDASIGINGDLFRPVTTERQVVTDPDGIEVQIDSGGEIGLLDNYQIYAYSQSLFASSQAGSGPAHTVSEFHIDYYDWPTGGPIVDSFDTITAGFGAGIGGDSMEAQAELRYDLYWDVREQGRSTNPFGRPSTR